MKLKITIAVILGLLLGTWFGILALSGRSPVSVGSVAYSSDYNSTSTRSLPAGTPLPTTTLLRGPGAFGGVTITGANTGPMTFYDGTTTTSHADRATTTLLAIPASAAAGYYPCDCVVQVGLVVDMSGGGLVPTSTITYRR